MLNNIHNSPILSGQITAIKQGKFSVRSLTRAGTVCLLAVSLAGCQNSRKVVPGIVPAAVDSLSSASTDLASATTDLASTTTGLENPFPDYMIGPQDELSITVYREPELSLPSVTVDNSGRFEMLLIGKVNATGKTPDELSSEISQRYGERYLVNSNVAVNVTKINSKRITLEGALNKPGIYAITDDIDLISSIAIASGPSEAAKLSQIAVFRKMNGQNTVAVFDYKRIRSGELANPQIKPGDIVVVGFSGLKQALQDVLQAAPLIGVFSRF